VLAAAACATRSADPRLADEGVAPWEVPAQALATQRLYRGAYDGPEGSGAFRATLRLVAADHFQLVLADRLGRTIATLWSEGERQRWVDHRRELYCTRATGVDLPGAADLPVPAQKVPALLLGRLPAAPATAPGLGSSPSLAYQDASGRRWTAGIVAGRPVRWALHDGTGALWWWRAEGRGGVLSHREGRQLRWQEVVVEPLVASAIAPDDLPAGFHEDCAGVQVGEGEPHG
jgi:hypothetical protein